MGVQRYAPAAFSPGNTPGTYCIGLWVGPQGQSGRVWKRSSFLQTPGFEPQTVLPVASHYTDCAIPGPLQLETVFFLIFFPPDICRYHGESFGVRLPQRTV